MAKQSFKAMVAEQVVNSQLQKIYEQQRAEDLKTAQNILAQYQPTDDDMALAQSILAQYPQQPAQEAQPKAQPVKQATVNEVKAQNAPIPSLEKPKEVDLSEWFKPKTASGRDINKESANRKNRENYQRQQQEEQIAAEKPYTDRGNEKWDKSVMDAVTALNSKDMGDVRRLAELSRNEGGQAISTSDKVDQWLSPEYKLSDKDKEQAKAYASNELQKYNYGPNRQPLFENEEDRQHYADMVNLLNKTNTLTNALSGVIKQPYNLGKAVSDAGRSLGNQLTGLGAAITDKLGVTEDATKRHNERVEASDRLFNQNDENMRQAFANAQKQNPGAYTGGQLAGQVGMYALTNPLFNSLGAAAGLGKAGNFALNQVGQNVQDLALDTIPRLNEYKEGGISDEERKDLIKSIGLNAAFNLGIGAAGEGISALAKNRAAKKAADEAFRANASEGADLLARLAAEDSDNIVRNATRQTEEAAQKIEELSKQIPELPPEANLADDIKLDDSEISNLLAKMEPSRPGGAPKVSPAIDNAAEELSKQMDAAEAVENAAKTQRPELPEETQEKLLSDFEEIFNSMNKMAADVEASGSAKAIEKYEKLQRTVFDYEEKLWKSDNLEEINNAKKAADAARQSFIREMKKVDPKYKGTLTGTKLGQAQYRLGPQSIPEDQAQEIVDDWVKQDIENPNRFVEDVSKRNAVMAEDAGIPNTTDPVGAYKLQTFADGDTPKEQWKTSKFRTNTVEKQGWGDQLPEKDYAYRVYSEAEQNADAAAKNLSVQDLIDKDQFDPSDVKQAMKHQRDLLDKGDEASLRKARRLGTKIAFETREAGRIPQALAEFDRTTPEGQVRLAQNAIDDIVDKKVGTGTSEALDNVVEKINKAYDKYGSDKEAFTKEVQDILDKDLKNYARGKNAKKMQSRTIKGKDKVLDMIKKGASIEDISDVIYKQNGGVKLTDQENKQIYDLLKQAKDLPEGSYEQEELLARAAKIAVAKAPSTVGQKIRSVLYTNMLGNFKTALSRNAFGNFAYQTLEQGRAPVAAAVDKATSLVTGKHSTLGWNKEKFKSYGQGFKKGASEQFKDIARGISTGRSGAKGWTNALVNNATTFNDTKKIQHFANDVEYYVKSGMQVGDRPWFEANYAQRVTELHQLIDRYGKESVAGLEGIKDADLDEVIDMIASVHGADSVFQKHGNMSKGLTDLRNGLGEMSKGAIGVDVLSTAASPFTMTPGNMLERAIEYTPFGLLKNAFETGAEVLGKKGFNQRRFVDEASRTITGLPVLYAAYKLAQKGGITGGFSTDQDEKQAQRDDGFIEYGLNVPESIPLLGGKTLDTSDLPVYGPFMQAGAVMAEDGISPQSSLQAAEAVLGGSTTQGLRRAFGGDSSSYSSQDSIVENLKNTILSSGSQLIPSLARQTAQTIDPYKRDMGEYGTLDYYWNLMKNSDPVGRQTLPIKYDVEGQPVLQNQGRNIGSKILENYFLPMNMSEYKQSPLNQEASRLLDSANTAMAFVPKAARKDLRQWDEKAQKEYSEEQFREYKKDLGTLNSEAGHALIESDFYKGLTDTEKAQTLSNVYSAMKQIAKENATGIPSDDKIAAAYKDGNVEGMINYLAGKNAVKESGYKSNSTVGKAIQKAADSGNTEAADDMSEQSKLLPSLGLDKPGPAGAYTKAYDVYGGLSAEDFARTYKSIDADHNQALKKVEVVNYMNAHNYDYKEGMKFWKAFAKTEGKSPWKIPVLEGNIWK